SPATRASTLLWATRFYEENYRKMQSPSTSVRRGSLAKTLWLATIWLGSSRPPRMLQFAMGLEQSSSPNRPCDFLAAKILIICAPSRLLAQGGAVSPRREKLLGGRCSQAGCVESSLCTSPFGMESYFT